ncbi:MAG: hypothetical protein NTX48_22985 [Planctomycetales bacterium]|nr:hypothetical protein [Planctomycetales bacterium]
MTSSTPSSPSVAAASGPRTPASQGVALIRTSVSQAKEFLTPTLVSIGVEIGTVVLLMALLLLMISTRSGDGGDAGGGSGNGTSGQGGTGEFVAPDSGSGTGADVTKVHANSGTSNAQPKSAPAPSPANVGTPLSPPEKQSHVFMVQDLPQPAANDESGGAGGGNGFSDLGDRLLAAGAKTGDVQISLAWNNGNDLDLHVETPGHEKIWYNRRQSSCGGELDVDMNAGGPASQRPVENVYWPAGQSPTGKFSVHVHHYANHGGRDPTNFQVTIKVKGKSESFSRSLRSGDAPKLVHEFTFP